MQRYKDYQPTIFDQKGYLLDDQQHWLVLPVMQTRDSEDLELSNFTTALNLLGGESDNVEVHRFGHWGPGWFEIIIINPADTELFKIATGIESALADYPCLDEEDYLKREFEHMCQLWNEYLISDRVDCCQKAGISIFSARLNDLPQGMYAEHLGMY